jgi:hypothetical protein
MSLPIISEFWYTISDFVESDSREEAIYSFIVMLVDQGYDLEDLADEFEKDREVMKQIKKAKDDMEEDEEDEEDYYSDDDF